MSHLESLALSIIDGDPGTTRESVEAFRVALLAADADTVRATLAAVERLTAERSPSGRMVPRWLMLAMVVDLRSRG